MTGQDDNLAGTGGGQVAPTEGGAGLSPTRIRFLSPESCRIHLGSHGALHATIRDERIYGGVYAVQAFPVHYPEGYISLIHTGAEGGDVEVGIIRDLSEFPESDAALIREALLRRYFVHTITSIRRIGWKYGYVAMDVDTDKGPVSFMIPWRHDNAVDFGRRGKVLIDLDENRYLIPDVEQFPARQPSEFRRYIYW